MKRRPDTPTPYARALDVVNELGACSVACLSRHIHQDRRITQIIVDQLIRDRFVVSVSPTIVRAVRDDD